MLSEWHAWLAELVRTLALDVPIHTKQMQSYSTQDGMNPERAAVDGYADLGGNELKFKWNYNDDAKKVNAYSDGVLLCSTDDSDVSITSEPYEIWTYSFTSVDENENETEAVEVSGINMGDVTKPIFYLDGSITDCLKAGDLCVRGYAYEEAELILAVYNNDKLESVSLDKGQGWLMAESNVDYNELKNKKAVAYFWQNIKPLRNKCEIITNNTNN